MVGYLDKVIRPLVLVFPKITAYVKTFKIKDGDKDTNNNMIAFRRDDEKLLEKYKTIWTKIENLIKILNQMLNQSMIVDI